MELKGMNCPKCGSPLNFSEDREFCYCSHCGTQVYKEDVNFDKRIEYKMHIDDNKTKIKSQTIQMVATIGLLLFTAIILAIVLYFTKGLFGF